VTRKLLEQGRIPRDESIVVSITGNGLKTQEAVIDALKQPDVIQANLHEFDQLIGKLRDAAD
jgi:threonine synthase